MKTHSKVTVVHRSSKTATIIAFIQLCIAISAIGNCLGFAVTESKSLVNTNKINRSFRLGRLSLSEGDGSDIPNKEMVDDRVSSEKVSDNLNGDKDINTWNPLRLAVLKLGFTELKYTSPLNYQKGDGNYNCANCGSLLFDSIGKYDSGSGWPSFWKTAGEDRVAMKREWDGRVECRCKSCGGHLGHAFGDGPWRSDVPGEELKLIPKSDPTFVSGKQKLEYTRLPRFCMNGASLRFFPKE